MHKSHLIGCAVGFVLALALVAFFGGGASLAMFGAVLICPVVMVTAMYLMARHADTHLDPAPPPVPENRTADLNR